MNPVYLSASFRPASGWAQKKGTHSFANERVPHRVKLTVDAQQELHLRALPEASL
jgi:hypothetical protein